IDLIILLVYTHVPDYRAVVPRRQAKLLAPGVRIVEPGLREEGRRREVAIGSQVLLRIVVGGDRGEGKGIEAIIRLERHGRQLTLVDAGLILGRSLGEIVELIVRDQHEPERAIRAPRVAAAQADVQAVGRGGEQLAGKGPLVREVDIAWVRGVSNEAVRVPPERRDASLEAGLPERTAERHRRSLVIPFGVREFGVDLE